MYNPQDIAARRSKLTPEQRALLEKRLRGESADAAGALAIPRRQEHSPALPSFAQRRLWFLDQLAPGSAAYNIPMAVRLEGSLDARLLARSLDEILRRHESLRTRFEVLAGEPMQVILATCTLDLPTIDLSALPAPAREAAVLRLGEAEARSPFDLTRAPLLRARLLRLAEAEHVLLLTLHHIISDGWSMSVLIRELAALYVAFAAGQPASLPPLPIQYADFALWQRQRLQGELLDRQLAYWCASLGGALPILELPADRPRTATQIAAGASHHFVLPQPLAEALKALSRREGATLFMTLLAAFQTLLCRYSGQEDILVGTPIANRSRLEIEGLIGLFVNTLVLRTDLSGAPTFRALLGRVGQVAQGAYAHEQMPFERLVDALNVERDLSRNPLFQVMFVLQNIPMSALELPNLMLRPVEIHSGTAKFDLWLFVTEHETAGLDAMLEYRTDLFDAATIARIASHFQVVLESVSADPNQRITDCPLLTAAERSQILIEWNAVSQEVRRQESEVRSEASDSWCIQELIAAQAARTPEAIAVVLDVATPDARPPTTDHRAAETRRQGDKEIASLPVSLSPGPLGSRSRGPQHLSYGELNARANQLAHHLRTLGVGPEVLVGVCMARSAELVIALLGVLKAGGAYLPLDPSYPAERLAFMLADSGARVLITTTDHRRPTIGDEHPDTLSPCHLVTLSPCHATMVDLARDWPAIAQQPAHSPNSATTPDNLAYVIYTSGSTGTPKGAMNTHGGIRNRLLWMQEAYQLTPADAVLQKTPVSFDVSVWEFFWPLLTGARLVLARPEGHRDSAYLADLIAAQQITTLHFVPSMLQLFLEEPDLERCRCLKRVICSGEALPFEVQERFFARLDARLHNLYGPTEAAVDVTFWPCQRASHSAIVPIGRPIANTQVYLLDQRLNLVPIGVPGELYIGGVQLARGYLSRPELTAEKFIPNPFATTDDDRPTTDDEDSISSFIVHRSSFPSPCQLVSLSACHSDRLYKTGDVARWLPNGVIEFLGRIDHQVKLRGFRIELGEIEAALAQHPAVRAAVALAREDAPGDKRLVAYVVTSDEVSVTSSEASPLVTDNSLRATHNSSLAAELRMLLAQRLPDYMVPSEFVLLDALPLLPNGKLDRRALPLPRQPAPTRSAGYIGPRNEIEERLVTIWAGVLGLERIGIDDNFFDLGGDSFKAIRIVQQFGPALGVMHLFKNPTIRGLAEHMAGGQAPDQGIVQRLTAATRQPARSLVCIPYGGGSPILYYPLAQALPPNYAVYTLALPGHDLSRKDEELKPIEEIAQACVEEIRTKIAGPLALYGHCVGVALTIEIARLLQAVEVEVQAIYLAGAFPQPDSKLIRLLSNVVPLDRFGSDAQIHSYLKSLGGFEDLIDPEELKFVMKAFRHDGRSASEYFKRAYQSKTIEQLNAPIYCIVGSQDPYTKHYQQRAGEWTAFSSVVELFVIEGGNHYFVKHQAAEVARYIVHTARLLDAAP